MCNGHSFEQDLQQRAPHCNVQLRKCDLRDQDSPMARPRSFIVGLHPKMHKSSQQDHILELPYKDPHNLTIMDDLETAGRPSQYDFLTVGQQCNVFQHLEIYNERFVNGTEAEKGLSYCNL